jgi:hypothetical protein
MMRVVRNQIAEESSCVWAESLYPAIAFQSRLQYGAESCPAVLQRFHRLRRRDSDAIQLFWNLTSLSRGLQPHHADVVHVSHNGRDGSPLASRGLGAPGFGWQVFDHVQVDAVIRIEGSQ